MALNLTQKKVLLGLNAYPEYSDRELAEALKLNRSTLTATRHFLHGQGYFQHYIIPSFPQLGAKIIGVQYGEYGGLHPITFEQRRELRKEEYEIPEYIFSFSSAYNGMSICMSPDFQNLKEPFDAWKALFLRQDPTAKVTSTFIPFSQCTGFRFLETHQCLASVLGLPPLKTMEQKKEKGRLSRKEKEVLLSWLQYPLATNEQLSVKIDVSRAVVGKIKQRLLDSGSIRMLNFPDWHKLGMEVAMLIHIPLNGDVEKIPKEIASRREMLLSILTPYEFLCLSLFRDYAAFQQEKAVLLQELQEVFSPGSMVKEVPILLKELRLVLRPLALLHKLIDSEKEKQRKDKER